MLSRAINGVALVEMAERFQNHLDRIRATLPCGAWGEAHLAGMAVPTLENLVLLVAFPCPCDMRAMAEHAALEVSPDEGAPVGTVVGCGDGFTVPHEFGVRVVRVASFSYHSGLE
jgi:hypothetical protein